jgi:hypothetical protein
MCNAVMTTPHKAIRSAALSKIIATLEDHYGPPAPPSRDPFELIVLENIAYLADDAQRAKTFAELKAKIGIDPENILRANRKTLAGVANAGILPEVSVEN